MGYHINKIPKGKLGEFSKIKEEFLELEDCVDNNNPVMAMIELSDLIGAIKHYAAKFNLTIKDLETMLEATERAFSDGSRK